MLAGFSLKYFVYLGIRQSYLRLGVILVISGMVIFFHNIYCVLISRFISGFGAGIFLAMVPYYINEFAPDEIVGGLSYIFPFSICIGRFLAYFVSYITLDFCPEYAGAIG